MNRLDALEFALDRVEKKIDKLLEAMRGVARKPGLCYYCHNPGTAFQFENPRRVEYLCHKHWEMLVEGVNG